MTGFLLLLAACSAISTTETGDGRLGKGIFNCGGFPRRGEYGKNDPLVAGNELLFEWKELEPEEGRYNWTLVESEMKPWTDAGKFVALRVMTACNHLNASPDWVFAAGAPKIDSASYLPNDNILYPVFWNPVFIEKWSAFVEAFGKRFDGAPRVEFVQVGGVGRWEETYVCSESPEMDKAWQAAGYSHAAYIEHLKRMTDLFKSHFRKTPVLLSISIGGPDPAGRPRSDVGYAAAEYSVERGCYLKQNGLGAYYSYTSHDHFSDIFHRYHQKTKLVFEQGAPTTHSWVGPQGNFRSIVNRALIDHVDYLWIYDEDLRQPSHREALEFAAQHLGNESVRELGDLYIKFERVTRHYDNPAVALVQDDECLGLFHSGDWVPPLLGSNIEPATVAGVPCKRTTAENPWILLDLDDNVIREESAGTRQFKRLTITVEFYNEGHGTINVCYNWDGEKWTALIPVTKENSNRWVRREIALENVRFPEGRLSEREHDFALQTPDESTAFRELRLRFD